MRVTFSLWLAAWALPALAHHSFAGEYDVKQPVKLKGVVTKVEWTNPHARMFVDVKDEKGIVSNWNLELASPNVLVRNGWQRTSLKAGDVVTVSGWRAKDGSNIANTRSVVLSNGRQVFPGSSGDDGN
jgi:hypothetical protein